jgi:hypothetical protein
MKSVIMLRVVAQLFGPAAAAFNGKWLFWLQRQSLESHHHHHLKENHCRHFFFLFDAPKMGRRHLIENHLTDRQ